MDVQIEVAVLMRSFFDRMRCARLCSLIFKYLHKFSIMLISGLCAGHVITGKLLSCFHWVVILERWGVALSSWKIQGLCRKCFAATGHKLSSKICIYFSDFIVPSTGTKVPTPPWVIHPQSITLATTLGCRSRPSPRQYGAHCSHSFRLTCTFRPVHGQGGDGGAKTLKHY